MRVTRTETNFEKYLKEEYRKNPGMKRRVDEEKKKTEKEIRFFNRIFNEWLEDFLWDEKFRKMLEKHITAHRKMEKSILQGIREARQGKTIPYEEVKRRLGLK